MGHFLDTEQQYAGNSDYLVARLADASALYEKAAYKLQRRLNEIASESGQSGIAEASASIALAADTGAAVQRGS